MVPPSVVVKDGMGGIDLISSTSSMRKLASQRWKRNNGSWSELRCRGSDFPAMIWLNIRQIEAFFRPKSTAFQISTWSRNSRRIVPISRSTNGWDTGTYESALFTSVFTSGVHFMQNNGERPSLERLIAQSTDEGDFVLRKIVLAADHVDELKTLLSREQLTRSSFMPTADNVSRDVQRRWLDMD
jgi:hypothetical protein